MYEASTHNRVMVIDDEEIMLISCRQILKKENLTVETYDTGEEGLKRLPEFKPQLLIVDLKMKEMDGFQVMKAAHTLQPDLIIVVITGFANIETAVEAMKAGAYDFLPKPFTPDELRVIINRGLEHWQLIQESERLRREKAEVERKFITLVSHQLKSPLVAVKQNLDVLMFNQCQDFSEQVQQTIRRCQSRIQEMVEIIHDWLLLAKPQTGILADGEATSDVKAIVEQIIEEHRQGAKAAQIALHLDLLDPFPLVKGDKTAIKTVLENLLNNAIKYNRQGGSVSVKISCAQKMICIEVSDTGIGIEKSAMQRLFSEFYRVKTEETQGIQGTGLGLAICKKIISELGGTIEVQSEVGVGTTFSLKMPVTESSGSST